MIPTVILGVFVGIFALLASYTYAFLMLRPPYGSRTSIGLQTLFSAYLVAIVPNLGFVLGNGSAAQSAVQKGAALVIIGIIPGICAAAMFALWVRLKRHSKGRIAA